MPDLIIKLVRKHPDKTHIKFNPYKLYGRYPRKRKPKIKYRTDQDEHYGIPHELLFIKIENDGEPSYGESEVCFFLFVLIICMICMKTHFWHWDTWWLNWTKCKKSNIGSEKILLVFGLELQDDLHLQCSRFSWFLYFLLILTCHTFLRVGQLTRTRGKLLIDG